MKTAVRDTSLDAHDQLRAIGALPNQEQQIMDFIAANYGESFSRSEIAWFLGMRLSAVCGRVNTLVEKGLLDDSGYKLCSQTQRRVHAVRLPMGQRELFQ